MNRFLVHFRYIGYCPQLKYQIGETFGRTTSQLLTDSRIASSGQPVLSPLDPNPPAPDQRRQLISRRALKLGDQKLFEKMVPGYTGRRCRLLTNEGELFNSNHDVPLKPYRNINPIFRLYP